MRKVSVCFLIPVLLFIAFATLGMKNPPREGESFAYPCPVSGGSVTLTYYMKEIGVCKVSVYNEGGSLVSTRTDSRLQGVQESPLPVSGFAPGIYIYTLSLGYGSGQSEHLGGKFIVKR